MKGKRLIRITLACFVVLVVLALVAWNSLPTTLMWYAEKTFAAKNYARAESALRTLLAIEPKHCQAHFLYARTLRQMARYADAEAQLGLAAEYGLSKEEGLREYGLLYAGFDFSLAKGALQRVLDEHPDDVEVLQALALGCMREMNAGQAEYYLQRWLETRPDDIQPLLERGRLYLDTRQFTKAIAEFREILKRSPEHYRAHLWLGLALLSDAKVAEAEPELRLCRQMRPDSAEPVICLAECAIEKRDINNAYTLLFDALALDPGSLMAMQDLANLHLSQRRYEEAADVFTLILQDDPNDKQAHLKLAQALTYMGRKEEARQHEQRFRELDEKEAERAKRQNNR
ncbi:MAG TPA: tetratricopeptide repeat protein [Gemmataceae bacterium]|jgi:Flp pilus assembly protein TadD|nr:tetratricopeptide repeat protein [Gemmataceae bacterium]